MDINGLGDILVWLVIPAAYALDALVGDPHGWPHPIRWMGRAIETAEPFFRSLFKSEWVAGAAFTVALIIGCWGLSSLTVFAAYRIHGTFGVVLEIIMIYYCLSVRSLAQAAMEIYNLLGASKIDSARKALSMIVGRDVARYESKDIARATVETVAENFVDGVVSPLFFAAIGGAPLAMAYKMVNTLDSMVGYKNERYIYFGRAAAKIDDAANYIPARLSMPIIAAAAQLLTGRCGGQAWKTAIFEGVNHTSPNAGYPEAAFAGALAVKLNGPNTYDGRMVEKPYIGVRFGAVNRGHIKRACDLMFLSALITTAGAWAAVCIM